MEIAVRILVIVGAGWLLGISSATALDWMQCLTIESDAERLACYDLITAESASAGHPNSSNDWDAEKDMIISRCREEMEEHGSRMVKYCVDKDIAAYEQLVTYPSSHATFITRCIKEMGEHGWRMVKYCADKDIAAERALGKIQNSQ